MVMRAKSPSVAWQVLNSLVDNRNSSLDEDHEKKIFKYLAMIVEESARH